MRPRPRCGRRNNSPRTCDFDAWADFRGPATHLAIQAAMLYELIAVVSLFSSFSLLYPSPEFLIANFLPRSVPAVSPRSRSTSLPCHQPSPSHPIPSHPKQSQPPATLLPSVSLTHAQHRPHNRHPDSFLWRHDPRPRQLGRQRAAQAHAQAPGHLPRRAPLRAAL
jgi:hypothetical protein